MYVTSPLNTYDTANVIPFSNSNSTQPSASHTYKVAEGKTLFLEGDKAEFLYEILEGTVRSTKMLSDGRRQVMNFGYPGDVIGLSHDCRYHSDCDAVTEVRVRVFRKNACSTSYTTDPVFSDHLLQLAAAEVTHMQEHFLMLGRKSAMEKIASFLVALLDRQSEQAEGGVCFDLPMKRSDIADFLGLTIETVSRMLTKLRKDKVIQLPKANRVCVAKPNVLRNLAENDFDL